MRSKGETYQAESDETHRLQVKSLASWRRQDLGTKEEGQGSRQLEVLARGLE